MVQIPVAVAFNSESSHWTGLPSGKIKRSIILITIFNRFITCRNISFQNLYSSPCYFKSQLGIMISLNNNNDNNNSNKNGTNANQKE